MGTVLHTWSNGGLVKIQEDSGERKRWALKREPTFLDAALAMDCMYGFQSIVGVNVNPSKRKLVSSCNSVLLIFTGTKRGSLWRLKESNFVLVALNGHKPSVTPFHNITQISFKFTS